MKNKNARWLLVGVGLLIAATAVQGCVSPEEDKRLDDRLSALKQSHANTEASLIQAEESQRLAREAAHAAAMARPSLPPVPQGPSDPPVIESGSAGAITTPAASGNRYQVRKGDTLWSLAKRFYGTGKQWPIIANANPAVGASGAIRVGMVLVIPVAQ